MNTEQFIEKQKRIVREIVNKDLPLQRAAASTLRKQATRIFVDGNNSSATPIGKYNATTPLYVNPKTTGGATSKLGAPKGKTGQSKFKDGTPHKTVWVESYKVLKGKIGQKNDTVRLVLSGDLRSDFSTSQLRKIGVHEYESGVKREANIKKAQGAEEKYGKIFSSTTAEVQNFFEVAAKEYNLILKNA